MTIETKEQVKKFIIFDETDGKSIKGETLKRIARRYGVKYVTNSKDLIKELK